MTTAELIAVDWGTSSFRGYLVDRQGGILDRRETADGILAVAAGGFGTRLSELIGPWRGPHGERPIILSGMIGSRQGWQEAPYVRCPAGLADVATPLRWVDAAGLGPIAIVPGLSVVEDGHPDVMRGEETQIFGALAQAGARGGLFVLPGTHAKWVRVEAGRIVGFKTYMTGEVYAALKGHTILGRLMSEPACNDLAAFARGVEAGARPGQVGALLHRLFSVRTLGLFDELVGASLPDYMSGLLIGAELTDAAHRGETITIIANDSLSARYERATYQLGFATVRAPPDCVVAGHVAIARAAQLIGGLA